MKILLAVALLVLVAMSASMPTVCAEPREEIKLTTIIPDQQVLRVKKGIISTANYRQATFPDGSIPANSLIVAEGDVGIGTTAPRTPAPNGLIGNLDTNDIWLRSTGTWLSSSSASHLRRRMGSAAIKGLQSVAGSVISYTGVPSISQGVEIFAILASASNASSIISLRGSMYSVTGYGYEPSLFTVWKDSTLVTGVVAPFPVSGVTIPLPPATFEAEVAAGDTASHRYSVRMGSVNARPTDMNSYWGNDMGGTLTSTFVVDEILP
jgi:hypothetical protein